MQLTKKRLGIQIVIALLVTGVATGLVINATWQDDSLAALHTLDLRLVFAALGLLIGAWVVDVFRMQAMTRALGYKISPLVALRTNLLGYFLSAVTPFTAGGGALQVYSLARAGLTVGRGTAAVLVNGFIAQFTLAVAGIVIVFGFDVTVNADPRLEQIIRLSVLVYAVVVIALVWLTWNIDKGRKLIAAIVKGVLRFVVDGTKVRQAAVTVDKAIVDIHRGLHDMFGRRSLWSLVGAAMSVVYYALQFAIVPVLAFGLGIAASVPQLIAVQVPIHLLASILPTPGGSGGLEFGLAGALLQHVSPAQVGIIVVTWRLLTFYFVLAVGGLVVLAFVRSELGRAAAAREELAAQKDGAAATHEAAAEETKTETHIDTRTGTETGTGISTGAQTAAGTRTGTSTGTGTGTGTTEKVPVTEGVRTRARGWS